MPRTNIRSNNIRVSYDSKACEYVARLAGCENFATGRTAGMARDALQRELKWSKQIPMGPNLATRNSCIQISLARPYRTYSVSL